MRIKLIKKWDGLEKLTVLLRSERKNNRKKDRNENFTDHGYNTHRDIKNINTLVQHHL